MSVGKIVIERLKETFPDARMKLEDSTGADSHWELKIATDAFVGMNKVKQHQAIYKPLRDLIDANRVHALKINSMTLDAWED